MIRFALIAGVAALVAGCGPGPGERCNPLQFSNDCQAGYQCVYPPNCGVAYCCPAPDPPGDIPASCLACPAPDLGTITSD